MRKLFFTLSDKVNFGINLTTHRGSQIKLYPGRSEEMPLDDDLIDEADLIDFYNKRYAPLGVTVKVLYSNELKIDDKPVETIKEEINLKDGTVELIAEEVQEEVQEEVLEEVQEKDIEDWTIQELRDFVKENKIKVSGKAKSDYVKAVKEFNKEA